MSKSEGKKGIHFKGERTQSTIIIIIGLLAFIAMIIANFAVGYTLMTAAVSAMATYEFVKAVGAKSKALMGVASAVSALTVAAVGFGLNLPKVSVIYSYYVLAMLILTVALNKTVKYTDTVAALFASVAIPYSFSCFIRLNNIEQLNPEYTHLEGIFLVMLVFTCSWLTDTFAFLVGRKIGKHKMTPNISPKKSFEGAIFGTVLTAAFNVLLLWIFSLVSTRVGHGAFMGESNMKYISIIPISIVLSIVSMFGDLAASVLKRNVGIKDYSNILPGHGGIMDRFDSTLFVLPTLYGIFALIF